MGPVSAVGAFARMGASLLGPRLVLLQPLRPLRPRTLREAYDPRPRPPPDAASLVQALATFCKTSCTPEACSVTARPTGPLYFVYNSVLALRASLASLQLPQHSL